MLDHRRAAAMPHAREEGRRDPPPTVGLALSGGGIRSATLSLGFLQALGAAGWIPRIDYLSTVSGGSYAGAFLGGLFQRRDRTLAAGAEVQGGVREALRAEGFPLRWLRDNGRYLAPAGASDNWIAFAVVLRNLVAIQLVMGVLVLTGFLAAAAVRAVIDPVAAKLLGAAGASSLWPGPWWAATALSAALGCLPTGIAYWLIGADPREDGGGTRTSFYWRPSYTMLVVIALCVVADVCVVGHLGVVGTIERLGGIALVVATLVAVASLAVRLGLPRGTGQEPRNVVTGWLKTTLILSMGAAAIAAVDSLAIHLYQVLAHHGLRRLPTALAGLVSTVAGTAAIVQRLGGLLKRDASRRVALPWGALAMVGAMVIVGALLVCWDTVAHALAAGWQTPPAGTAGLPAVSWPWLRTSLVAGVAATIAFGRSYAFLNRSSLSSLYAERIARTYVGASNQRRENDANGSVTRTIPGDDIDIDGYTPHLAGGPLHIINTTLNETVPARSQFAQRDRHGMNMAVGPAGISVGVRHHAIWEDVARDPIVERRSGRLRAAVQDAAAAGFRVFPASAGGKDDPAGGVFRPESMTVAQWTAVSGAAVSTGLGWRTSLGLNLLIGLVNARLGRWWWSGVAPSRRPVGADYENSLRLLGRLMARALPVQAHLLDEFLGRFHGPASPSWYLTDGGHFENTGAYELIRRQLEVIIVCDNGADDESTFSDMADLVRKARADFGAEITLATREVITAWSAGDQRLRDVAAKLATLEELGFGGGPAPTPDGVASRAGKYAAVGKIEYADGSAGLLVLVKPRVTGAESLDVREYGRAHPDFPQQSTADQFFDDRQWESYRRLGELMGETLFAKSADWPLWLLGEWPPTSGLRPDGRAARSPGAHSPERR